MTSKLAKPPSPLVQFHLLFGYPPPPLPVRTSYVHGPYFRFMSFIRTDDQISIYRGQEWLLDAVTDFDVGAQET